LIFLLLLVSGELFEGEGRSVVVVGRASRSRMASAIHRADSAEEPCRWGLV